MNKRILFQLMTSMMLVCLCVFTSSCSKDDDEGNDNFEQTENVSNQDPEGTIVLNMSSGAKDNYYQIGSLGRIHVDAANNFHGQNEGYKIDFVALGKVDGLGKVNHIPMSGWAESAAVVPGTGYIMRYTPGYYSGGDIQYARIYVIDYLTTPSTDEFGMTTGSYSGATIKYQAPFKGADEAIDLTDKTLVFDAKGGSKQLTFNNKNIIVFSAKSSESWCDVKKLSDNGIVITVPTSNKPDVRTATITLTTAYEHETTIKVTQSGVQPFISLDTEELVLSGAEESRSIAVGTNYILEEIQMTGTTDWCKAELVNTNGYDQDNSSVHSYTLSLNVKANTETSSRTAKLTLTSKDKKVSATLTVKQENVKITLNQQEIVLESGSSNYTDFSFTSPVAINNLSVTCDSSWCTPSRYNEYYSGTNYYYSYRIFHQANYSIKQRTCKINISIGTGKNIATVNVTQKGDVITTSGTNTITVEANATYCDFDFNCNASTEKLNIVSDADWCKPSFYSTRIVRASFQSNTTDVQCTAKITLSHKGENDKVVFTVIQKGATVTMPDTIWFDKNSHTETTTITTNISNFTGWEVTSSASWCRPSTNGKQLTLRLDETTKNRVCTISFKGISKTIKVVQSKYAVGDSYSEGAVSGTVGYMSGNQRYIFKEVGTAVWSKENVSVGATDSSNGLSNMTVIKKLPDWKTMYPAFALCDALNVSKVSGWFLPSVYEAKRLPLSGWHWTSTESDSYNSYIASQNIQNTKQKNVEYSVVAVRKF